MNNLQLKTYYLSTLIGLVILAMSLLLNACTSSSNRCPIVIGSGADTRTQWAATELATFLGELYPADEFPVTTAPPPRGRFILLSHNPEHPFISQHVDPSAFDEPGEFIVTHSPAGSQQVGIICGNDSRAVLDGVYSLLDQQLGYGFYLYRNATESASTGSFDFAKWNLQGKPLVTERVIFNWYNFISGVSTWNLEDYKHWVRQAARMRHTDVMLHAYGWAPFTEFTHNGVTKPVEYLQNTAFGRHWMIEHTEDVRKLIGGEVFANVGPIFGAEVSKVGYGGITEENRVARAKAMLHEVVDYAANTVGMKFNWAFDVDTTYGSPQNIILTLPESARFPVREFWLPRPDTEEGYALFRSMIQKTMEDYPGITTITLWARNGRGGAFGGLTTGLNDADLPEDWQAIYDAAPEAARTPFAPGHIYHAKVAEAFRRALNELGYPDVSLGFGSWWREKVDGSMYSANFTAAHYFLPRDLSFYPLDYYMAFGANASFREQLAAIGAERKLILVEWAHHDDGGHLGRPYQPPVDFADKLREINASGYGVIHWMTRPLDIFFKNIQNQIWSNSQNEPLKTTTDRMAHDFFGQSQADVMADYLYDWITTAPRFGRETGPALGGKSSTGSDSHVENFDARAADCDRRIAILDQVDPGQLSPRSLEAWNYFRGHEEWIKLFHLAQKDGNRELQEQTIRKYAEKASHDGGMTRGEMGILIQQNLKWLNLKSEEQQATEAN